MPWVHIAPNIPQCNDSPSPHIVILSRKSDSITLGKRFKVRAPRQIRSVSSSVVELSSDACRCNSGCADPSRHGRRSHWAQWRSPVRCERNRTLMGLGLTQDDVEEERKEGCCVPHVEHDFCPTAIPLLDRSHRVPPLYPLFTFQVLQCRTQAVCQLEM